jgi:hypothetical protein
LSVQYADNEHKSEEYLENQLDFISKAQKIVIKEMNQNEENVRNCKISDLENLSKNEEKELEKNYTLLAKVNNKDSY